MGKHKDKSKKHKRDKKHKEKTKRNRRRSSSSSSVSSSEEWVEKNKDPSPQSHGIEESKAVPRSAAREDWMSLPSSFLSESHLDKRKSREEAKRLEREKEKYNPRENVRELNPFWKDGGDGLPKFKKPSEDEDRYSKKRYQSHNKPKTETGWRKKSNSDDYSSQKSEPEESSAEDNVLSDKELNILASKLVKAEILGNTKLVAELKEKLERARQLRECAPPKSSREDVILTETNIQGHSRPLKSHSDYGESSRNPKRQKKYETHKDGERVRYFADDDKHSLQQMFENEKFNSVHDQNSEFVKLAGKIRKNDDVDDIFTDKIRRKKDDSEIDSKNRDRAIGEHKKVAESIDNCRLCIQSESMAKHLMVALGDTVLLSLPPYEPLTQGHCCISPIRHVACSTLLDENEWSDLLNFRRALTRMFLSRNEDVIFFESAKNLERHPHMRIECIPVDKEEGDMAPIYFKKAIDECEAEWAQNKKLVSLKGRDVRRAVPKGLSYFFVSFGMEEGYAHVIEDEKDFPDNFAQEVIGGMLDLHHSKWRKPKFQKFNEQSERVLEFSKQWKNFDCTILL